VGDGLADVVRLPLKQRLCADCDHALLGIGGVFCGMYHESIHNERVAEECEEYTRPDTGPVTIIKGGS
jgi:hypothetical protein